MLFFDFPARLARKLQLRFLNHSRPQGTWIRIKNRSGIRLKNEPRTQFDFPPQLLRTPSSIAQINMKNARVWSLRDGVFEEGFGGNQINAVENVFRSFELRRRLNQG